jgi:hypothetical protein
MHENAENIYVEGPQVETDKLSNFIQQILAFLLQGLQ